MMEMEQDRGGADVKEIGFQFGFVRSLSTGFSLFCFKKSLQGNWLLIMGNFTIKQQNPLIDF